MTTIKETRLFIIISQYSPGVALSFLVAILAWFLGKQLPQIGGAVFAIVFGMIFSLVRRKPCFEKGLSFSGKKILQYSIILLGFEMNMHSILVVGYSSLWIMLFTLSSALISTIIISKILRIQTNKAILIGVGTSICGGSAIAATAPVIHADEEDVSQAISIIFLFNIIAIFLFPALGHLFGLSDKGFAMWVGTAVNDTSSVVATASAWSQSAQNNTALAYAVIVKLTRTLLIVPITLFFAFYMAWKAKKDTSAKSGNYSFVRIFPWFVLGFLLAALTATFLPIPEAVSSTLVETGKFLIVMAMAAIGMKTNVRKLLTQSLRPLLLGLGVWFFVATVSLLVQMISGQF